MDLGSVNAPPPLYTETLALAGQERNYDETKNFN
tara:strand:+ start:820 stop:921 length:102 start_codon:yes stop_codon:yes gene_type:complete